MDNLPFPLDSAVDRHHARPENNAPASLEKCRPDNEYSDFTQATRSRTGTVPFANMADVFDAASGLLATAYPFKRSVRLLGVTLSSLTNDQDSDATEEQPQLDLSL